MNSISSYGFEFFERIYCVNLPQSPGRWNTVSTQFQKVGILDRVERVWADPPRAPFSMSSYRYPRGEFGVCLSHMKALVCGLESRAKNILVFEDDVSFFNNSCLRVREATRELPKDWKILYLGGRPRAKLKKHSSNLVQVTEFTTATSYALSASGIRSYLDLILSSISNPFPEACCDNILSRVASESGYCVYPPICGSIQGYSVIRNSMRNYTDDIERDWVKYEPA